MEHSGNMYDEKMPSTCPMYIEVKDPLAYNQECHSKAQEQQINTNTNQANINTVNSNLDGNNNNGYDPSQINYPPKNYPSSVDMCLIYPSMTPSQHNASSEGYDWYPLPSSNGPEVACSAAGQRPPGEHDCRMVPSSYQIPYPLIPPMEACGMCYQTNPWTGSTSHHPDRGCTKCVPGSAAVGAALYSNSGREARNRAEKNRRDRLNGCIQELSTLVPHVADSTRRVDKIAVLRFATHGLRLKHVFGKSSHPDGSPYTTNSVMKLLDSFLLTLTCNGQIVLVSSNVEEYLGHCQPDLYGQNILNITHPEDREIFKRQLIPTDMDGLFNVTQKRMLLEGNKRQRCEAEHTSIKDEERQIEHRLRKDKRSFVVRLARAGPRSEPVVYELVLIRGSFRRSDMAPRNNTHKSFLNPLNSVHLSRRSRNLYTNEDTFIMPIQTISGNDVELIAVARVLRPATLYRTVNLSQLEYKTRHLIDGRIVDCDQRISIVAGYMKDEVCNLSPFTFIHRDDVKWVMVALRQMYDCRSSYGESTYRLFTRSGEVIYLHTKGFLEMNNLTNQMQSFVCVNTLLNEIEGQQLLLDMKRKYSVIINSKSPQLQEGMYVGDGFQELQESKKDAIVENCSDERTSPATLELMNDATVHLAKFLESFSDVPKDNGQRSEEETMLARTPNDLCDNLVTGKAVDLYPEYQENQAITQHHYVSSSSDAPLADVITVMPPDPPPTAPVVEEVYCDGRF